MAGSCERWNLLVRFFIPAKSCRANIQYPTHKGTARLQRWPPHFQNFGVPARIWASEVNPGSHFPPTFSILYPRYVFVRMRFSMLLDTVLGGMIRKGTINLLVEEIMNVSTIPHGSTVFKWAATSTRRCCCCLDDKHCTIRKLTTVLHVKKRAQVVSSLSHYVLHSTHSNFCYFVFKMLFYITPLAVGIEQGSTAFS